MRLSRHAQTLGGVRMRLSQRLSRHRRFSGRFGRVFYSVSPTQAGERVRLSQRLSRLSRFLGKSRAADMRDRLSQPYVYRLGKSVSLGRETLPGDYAEDVERQARTAAETLAAAPKLATHGGDRKTESSGSSSKLLLAQKSSNDPSRLAARINRDHPEIAERVKAGDPQNRAALLWLSMGWLMSPTRYRASSRTGGGADR
jgi:hypothetical protein